MSIVNETTYFSSPVSTIISVQGGIYVSLHISSTSGEIIPSTPLYLTLFSLWIMPLISPFPSLAKSIVGQDMITSPSAMSSIQFGIGSNHVFNLLSGFVPPFSTLVGSTVISNMGYPFGWN